MLRVVDKKIVPDHTCKIMIEKSVGYVILFSEAQILPYQILQAVIKGQLNWKTPVASHLFEKGSQAKRILYTEKYQGPLNRKVRLGYIAPIHFEEWILGEFTNVKDKKL